LRKHTLLVRLSDTTPIIRNHNRMLNMTISEVRNELKSLLDKGINRFKILLFDNLLGNKSK